MKIGIIGTGRIASGLGKQWLHAGHEVCFGSRDKGKAQLLASSLDPSARGGTIPEAAGFGDVVLLAVPWAAVPEVLQAAGSLEGKTLIDCINPFVRTPEGMDLAVGRTSSGAEEIAKWAPGAQVVKAFNTIFSQVIHQGPRFGQDHALLFYCGDDASAKSAVNTLASDVGFDPVDIGPLRMARYLEPLTVVIVQLQRLPGMSSDMALGLLRREGVRA